MHFQIWGLPLGAEALHFSLRTCFLPTDVTIAIYGRGGKKTTNIFPFNVSTTHFLPPSLSTLWCILTVWLQESMDLHQAWCCSSSRVSNFVKSVAEKRSYPAPVLWRSWTMQWLAQRGQITAISLWTSWVYGLSFHSLWKLPKGWRKLGVQRRNMKVSI